MGHARQGLQAARLATDVTTEAVVCCTTVQTDREPKPSAMKAVRDTATKAVVAVE